ncbi:MAG TPA: FHA domain-containing protein [Polyangiaceae bacterium]|nr:FHA domain-containing protein [Polyangiaceae bacterium]
MWALTIEDEHGATTRVDLARDVYSMGRAPGCTICLLDRNVSRHHATLCARPDGGWELVDHESRFGCYLNGRRVRGRSALAPGDLVQIGDYHLRVGDGAAVAAEVAAAGAGAKPDRLVVVEGAEAGRELRLDRGPVAVGGGEGGGLRLSDPALGFVVRPVGGGRYEVMNVGPRAELSVNFAPVFRKLLEDGDRIEVTGEVALRFLRGGRAGPPRARPPGARPSGPPSGLFGEGRPSRPAGEGRPSRPPGEGRPSRPSGPTPPPAPSSSARRLQAAPSLLPPSSDPPSLPPVSSPGPGRPSLPPMSTPPAGLAVRGRSSRPPLPVPPSGRPPLPPLSTPPSGRPSLPPRSMPPSGRPSGPSLSTPPSGRPSRSPMSTPPSGRPSWLGGPLSRPSLKAMNPVNTLDGQVKGLSDGQLEAVSLPASLSKLPTAQGALVDDAFGFLNAPGPPPPLAFAPPRPRRRARSRLALPAAMLLAAFASAPLLVRRFHSAPGALPAPPAQAAPVLPPPTSLTLALEAPTAARAGASAAPAGPSASASVAPAGPRRLASVWRMHPSPDGRSAAPCGPPGASNSGRIASPPAARTAGIPTAELGPPSPDRA